MVGDTKLKKTFCYIEISITWMEIGIILLKRYIYIYMFMISMLHYTLYVKTLYKRSQPKYYFELDTPKDNTKTI